ncbi:hypothetical protein WCE39_08135 [Luteimonas sp. MJ174]|uniref:hypothetical protein n=1 Tax=Luteimonas sp. MJ174 TaxID=3129237 RepID=UPI0031BA1C10
MSAVLAVALLASIPLLLIVGELRHMRVVMKAECRKKVQSSADLQMAARILEFDDVSDYAKGVLARAYESGIYPERRKAPR